MKTTLHSLGVVALFAAAIPCSLHAQTNTPRIIAAGRTNGVFSLAWTNTGTNAVTIERRTSLASGSWSAIASNNTAGTHSDTNAPGGAAFYRVRMVTTPPPPPPPDPAVMVLIPAGNFQMGNQMDPSEGNTDELPVHTVYVSAFYMDKYEVTKALWDDVANWAATNGYDISAASASGKATNHPVQTVSWANATKWCNARSERYGLTPCYNVSGVVFRTGNAIPNGFACDFAASGYRLPTEAEWEKAARGNLSGQRFPWGLSNTITHNLANYYSVSSYAYDVSPTSGFHPLFSSGSQPYTSPVGDFAPNGYGLYDMAGNVAEWCWDLYATDYYSTSASSDPRGALSGSFRVFRGGNWIAFKGCRVADRPDYNPGNGDNGLGFRTVRSSAP